MAGDQVGVESRGEIQLFKRNEGRVDRIVRVVVGLILLVTGIVGFLPTVSLQGGEDGVVMNSLHSYKLEEL